MMGLFKLFIKRKRKTDEDYIMRYATMCGRCNRNGLREYEYELTCFMCGLDVEKKQKKQLTKNQNKKEYHFNR